MIFAFSSHFGAARYVWSKTLCMSYLLLPDIHTYLRQSVMKIQKPSQGDGFWVSSVKTPHRERVFETHPYSRQLISMLVCMFQKSCACGGFFKTPLPVEGFSKHLSLWGVLQNLPLCEGFFKTPLPVKGFSKPLSLWRVFQNPSPCEGFFKTRLPVRGFSKPLSLWGVFQNHCSQN